MHKKILFAAGGTGGHLFPAQALARQLREIDPEMEILFAGGKLGSNPFFHKLKFPFREITSSTPFRHSPIRSLYQLAKGLFQSLKLNREFTPDLIVGFGSFYSFPLLLAARLQNIPYILVESNALPGKVNRLFSAKASLSALQFQVAEKKLKGKSALAKIPHWSQELSDAFLSKQEARKSYGLSSDCLTLLIFGGSQGASAINEAIVKVEISTPIQVIHLCGLNQDAHVLIKKWEEKGIRASVKPFEEKMHLAWKAADFVVCRAGANTCAEVIESSTPALFIPWPGASDGHQRDNALYFKENGAGLILEEADLGNLQSALELLIEKRKEFTEHLSEIKSVEVEELSTIVMRHLI